MEPWTSKEINILKSIHIDPVKSDREKLITLVNYFKKGGGVWAVCEGETGPVNVSRGLGRKVRDLTLDHKLDWLQVEEAKLIDTSSETATGDFHMHWDNLKCLFEIKNKQIITKEDMSKFARDVNESSKNDHVLVL